MSSSPKKEEEQPWWRDSVMLFSRLSGWIVAPVILALFVGKWLDRKYDTDPWLLLLTVGLAFIISSVGIVKEARSAMNDLAKSDEKKSQVEKKDRDDSGRAN